jgi:3-oxoacyl-[acyl-carrier protein] reductase
MGRFYPRSSGFAEEWSVRELEGKVALVTGANQGIGAATAVALSRLGADVAVTFHAFEPADDDPGRPVAYAEQRRRGADDVLAAIPTRSLGLPADLRDPEVVPGLFDATEAELGPVDILVHNASGWTDKDTFLPTGADRFGRSTAGVAAATFDRQFAVDARAGAVLIAEHAHRHRARAAAWGRIVTLTSGGPMGFPGEVSYGAAKAALENYTMSASTELASLGITANVVYPPVTDTGWVTDDVRRFVEASTDHHHVATPEEVAEVITWLCTPAADLVTGNVIRLR